MWSDASHNETQQNGLSPIKCCNVIVMLNAVAPSTTMSLLINFSISSLSGRYYKQITIVNDDQK